MFEGLKKKISENNQINIGTELILEAATGTEIDDAMAGVDAEPFTPEEEKELNDILEKVPESTDEGEVIDAKDSHAANKHVADPSVQELADGE